MKSFGSVLVLAIALYHAVAEEVITLTQKNFQNTIDSNEFVLVEFYAPWCGHCKKLAPEYEKAAVAMKEVEPKVVIAKVDATAENDLASKFGVKGFPTLKWFVNGEVSDYSGGRTEATIVTWLKKKTGPPAEVIKTVDQLTKFKDQAEAVVLGLFQDETEAAAFLKLAQNDDNAPYGVCYGSCDDVIKAAEISSDVKIIVLQQFDEGKAVFSGDYNDSDEIRLFISSNLLPLVIPFTQQSAPKIFGGPVKDQVLLFLDSHDSEEAKAIVSDVSSVAKTHKGKIMFVTVAKSDARILDFFGVTEKDLPTARIINMGQSGAKKYKFTGESITAKAIDKFVDDYFAGNLKLDLKSEEPLPESEQGNVRVVVGKDFEKVVSQPGKDVLVEFYAPWCGHCKKLEPEYNAVGEHFKNNENIVIAKCDATANEVERVPVTGFPTLKFFPANSADFIDYDGARTKEGIIEWIEKNAVSLK